MKDGIVIGVFRCVIGDGYFIEQEDGTRFDLVFENEQRVDELPPNMPVAVVIANNKVPDIDNFWQEVPVFSAGSRNDTTKYIAIASISTPGVTGIAQETQRFWLTFAHKYWDVRTFTFGLEEEDRDCNYLPPSFCGIEMQKAFDNLPEDKKPDWLPDYWYIYGGYHQRYCGQAQLGGRRGVSYVGQLGCGEVGTVNHELGHNFGLHHASTNINGKWIEYGDGTSVMGNDRNREGLNAVNMYHLGLYDADEINRVTTNSELVICPHEIPKEARFSNETVYNIIKGTDGKEYMVSNRKHRGGQNILKKVSYLKGVAIHEIRNSRSVYVEGIRVGETSTIIPGVTLNYLEHLNESARVEVRFDNDTTQIVPNEIVGEPFPEKFTNTELSEVHNGLWYDPIRNGQGLDLHVKGDRAVLAWYFHPDNKPYGTSDWLIASFDLGEGTEKFDLMSVAGASWSDPTKGEPIKVGEGQIYFTGPNNGVFQWRLSGASEANRNFQYGRGHLPIVPITKEHHEDSGVYYDPERNNEGFTLRFLEGGNRCVGFWYTYNYKLEPKEQFQRRRWFMLEGTLVDGKYELTASKVGGRFMDIQLKVPRQIEEMGACTLTPTSDNGFRFVSNVPNYNLNIDIKRLF